MWLPSTEPKADVIDAVRGAMLRHMDRASITPMQIASATGYSQTTIWRFLEGAHANLTLAQALVYAYPLAVGTGLPCVCQCCGRLQYARR